MGAVQHKLPSAERILKAARELFATKGFHQTSMAELAAAADISVGLIYRSFTSKTEIIEAIVRTDFVERLDIMQGVIKKLHNEELTVVEALRQLYVLAITEGNEALSFDILAEGFRNESVGQTIGDLCGDYRACLRDLAQTVNKDLTGDDLEGAIELLLGSMFGLGHRSISQPNLSTQNVADISARTMVAALTGIRPECRQN